MINYIFSICLFFMHGEDHKLDLLIVKRDIARIEVKKSEITLKLKKSKFERLKALAERKAINTSVLDEAHHEYDTQELDVQVKKLLVIQAEIEIKIHKNN